MPFETDETTEKTKPRTMEEISAAIKSAGQSVKPKQDPEEPPEPPMPGKKTDTEGSPQEAIDAEVKKEMAAPKDPIMGPEHGQDETKLGGEEFWKITRQEYEKKFGKPKSNTTVTKGFDPHRSAVEIAVNQGKPVPEKVLKDYPDLIDEKTKMSAKLAASDDQVAKALSKSKDIAKYAIGRIENGMRYGSDMASSAIVSFSDALSLLEKAIEELKRSGVKI